jgi:hypothetical protein
MTIHERFPAITRAAQLMAYDNGSISREHTIETVLTDLDSVLGAEGVYEKDLVEIDRWLETLSPVQLTVVCCGEETEQEKMMVGAPALTNGLLNEIFMTVA